MSIPLKAGQPYYAFHYINVSKVSSYEYEHPAEGGMAASFVLITQVEYL